VKYISLNALNRIRSPLSTFAPVKSFIHVSVRTDDKVYNCKTAAIIFIYRVLIASMISKLLNVNICRQELILISASQRNPILWPYNIPLIKVYANMYERLDWRSSLLRPIVFKRHSVPSHKVIKYMSWSIAASAA
jgi:hypothetical protein